MIGLLRNLSWICLEDDTWWSMNFAGIGHGFMPSF